MTPSRLARCPVFPMGLIAALVTGCPEFTGPTGGGTASDVPCLSPTEWLAGEPVDFMYRAESADSDALLFTTQTEVQLTSDATDGTRDFSPHQAVYRFDSEFAGFTVVDDSLWEAAQGAICSGCPGEVLGGPLEIQDGRLLFNGVVVPVAGRRAVRIFDAAASECGSMSFEAGDVAAVLSIDGYVALLGASTGQHYHQLFSNVDGSQVGPTLRLSMGGLLEGTVGACWLSDSKYVIYEQGTQSIPVAGRICVVPVAEALAEHEGE